MQALQIIEMFAGYNPSGQPVAEKLQVRANEDGTLQLVKSPAFIKGLAAGDTIKLDPKDQAFEIVRRSGNVCIRVYAREDLGAIAEALTAALEKLGGELDIQTPRMLVYSVHVSLGFNTIEKILGEHLTADCQWLYGNVYDPQDGETPLNWWQEILAPE
ncbi:DUF4265 domain-containing protein [Simiduia sp. 21SJ11W-1]|uniref:DUF4265 domain-containing protein n=1 Tax=Simiduia sp. 21SJ11W-1 TaxID=2909669 RepID=UPI00209D4938|nr:DUF4265 domain-containing protein [Simiduia sp. 21SJ11W-1]UTA47972.1 DUF4265 domain-containing protein [Simiduia sp. 21SJ11W-1]